MKLKDKIAIVTGSSRGIGRGIAECLAKEGALVVIHYGSNAKAADETVRAIKSKGGVGHNLGHKARLRRNREEGADCVTY